MQIVSHLTYISDRITRAGFGLEQIMENSIEYYERRLEQELTLAERAEDPAIRHTHLEMAQRYQGIVDSGEVPDGRVLHRVVMDKLGNR